MSKIINIEPSNNIFEELGNTNYSLEEALSELIDNSISARVDNSVNIEISFYIDKNTGKSSHLIIKDDASGIKENDISRCVSPAGKQTIGSLNEHGLGLKSSIASLGKLNYLKTKNINENGFELREFSWKLELFDTQINFKHGTEISINTTSAKIVNIGKYHAHQINALSLKLGARYRKLFNLINLNIKLTVFDNIKELSSKNVTPITPLYYNPWGKNNKPLIYKKKFNYGNTVAYLTFGYAPKDESEYEAIGENIKDYTLKQGSSGNHPYCISVRSQGLDLIMNDRVISFSQINEIDLTGTRESHYNQIRGEIILEKGFQTTSTKNNIVKTDECAHIFDSIKNYLNGDSDEKHKIGPHKSLISNPYTKGKDFSFSNENELKDKIEKQLKMPTSIFKNSVIVREFVVEEYGLKIDLLVDEIPWEVKNDVCTSHRISQLVTYMVCQNVKKGVIVATKFNNTCLAIIEKYKKIGFDIEHQESNIYL